MPSDDESSCFDVHSISSDTESQANWDASTDTGDHFDLDPGHFRMPAPSTGYAARCVPVPRQKLKALKLPAIKPNVFAKGIEFIIFATIGTAKEISMQLQKASGDSEVATSYYDGSGSCRLSGSLDAKPTERVAILYFSTVDSYDPLIEYEHFVEKEGHSVPCTPIADDYIDPFCLSSESIPFFDKNTLMEVTVDRRRAFIPVPMNLIQTLSAYTFVPSGKYSKRLRSLNTPTSAHPGDTTLASLIVFVCIMLILRAYLMKPNPHPNASESALPPVVFTSGAPEARNVFHQQALVDPSVHLPLSAVQQVGWADPYFYLNLITESVHTGAVATLNCLSSFMANTLQLIQNVLQKTANSASYSYKAVKSGTSRSIYEISTSTGKVSAGITRVSSSWWRSTEAYCNRWLNQASNDYPAIAKKQFSKYLRSVRNSRPNCKAKMSPGASKQTPKYTIGDLLNVFN